MVFAPDKPPSTSIDIIQWHFGTNIIVTALSDSTIIASAYRDRVSFDRNTLALELRNLRLDDSGIYRLTVITAGHHLTGETSLQVFGECVAKNWFSILTTDSTGLIADIKWVFNKYVKKVFKKQHTFNSI